MIDDDPEIQAVVRDRLESLGHTCETVGSQTEARELIGRGCYSYILLDLEIPVAYGRPPRIPIGKNMIQEIRSTPGCERVPILVITAHRQTEIAVDVMKLGAVDFVPKPFQESGQTLEKSILEALEKAAREARTVTRGKPHKTCAHKAAEPERFTGGELVIYSDRMELCGVQICDGSDDGGLIRRILEALTEKTPLGKIPRLQRLGAREKTRNQSRTARHRGSGRHVPQKGRAAHAGGGESATASGGHHRIRQPRLPLFRKNLGEIHWRPKACRTIGPITLPTPLANPRSTRASNGFSLNCARAESSDEPM